MRRKDREMPSSFALQVADKCEWVVLSMVDPDGRPYCVPLSIVREGNAIYFHTARLGRKLDCLRRNPRVCMAMVGDTLRPADQFTTAYESAIAEGMAQEVTDEAEKRRALKRLCLRHTPANMENFERELERSFAVTGVWKMEIDVIAGKCKRL